MREKLKPHWLRYSKSSPPEWLMDWVPRADDVPDAVIHPENSIVLELIGNEIVPCVANKFLARRTLRFPRCRRPRYDKNWYDAMSMEDLQEIERQGMNRSSRAAASTGCMMENFDPEDPESPVKKRRKKGPQGPRIMPQFLMREDVLNITDEARESKLFDNKEFCVMAGSATLSKHDAEKLIVVHSGMLTQNHTEDTDYILAGKETQRVKNLIQMHSFSVLHLSWLQECVNAKKILTPAPRHYMYAEDAKVKNLNDEYDIYGDHFSTDTTVDGLRAALQYVDPPADGAPGGGPVVIQPEWGLTDIEMDSIGNPNNIFSRCVCYVDRYAPLGGEEIPDRPLEVVESLLRLRAGVISRTLDVNVTHVITEKDGVHRPRLRDIHARIASLRDDPGYKGRPHVVTSKWVADSDEKDVLRKEEIYHPRKITFQADGS